MTSRKTIVWSLMSFPHANHTADLITSCHMCCILLFLGCITPVVEY